MYTDSTRFSVPFTPLSERILTESPHLAAPIAALRESMGDANFAQYIDSLAVLRKVDDQLLLITRREMHRSILVGRFLQLLKDTFAVTHVRIVTQ